MTDEETRHAARETLMAKVDAAADRVAPVDPPISIGEVLGRALAVAVQEWHRGVSEPGEGGDWERIDTYIRGPQGLGWSSADVSNLGERIAYTHDGQFQWCGAFAAFCQGVVGLHSDLRSRRMPSTVRLDKACRDGRARRIVAAVQLFPGDIAVVGKARSTAGDHIVIVEKVTETSILTVEGNAHGLGPQGQQWQGVIRRERPFDAARGSTYRFLYGARWMLSDYGL